VAMEWASGRPELLRKLTPGDFMQLPMPAGRAALAPWWTLTSYAAWGMDGNLHPMCHAMGYAGEFWAMSTRAADTRFHLSFQLTQEFVPVSRAVPEALHGDPAVQFYDMSMLPPKLLRFPTGISGLLSALTVRWGYFHGNPIQAKVALSALLPVMIKECAVLQRFLTPSRDRSTQLNAYTIIAGVLAPNSEMHKLDTVLSIDKALQQYIPIVFEADAAPAPVYAETRAVMLKGAVEAERMAVASAPHGGTSTGAHQDASANQKAVRALVSLKSEPLILGLESQLLRLWNADGQRPVEVFEHTLASRSLACIAILFGNTTGVRDASPIYAVLEAAAKERLNYFAFKLSTPSGGKERPDHTCWYSYPPRLDKGVKSPDFETFSKINMLELGATIRQLRRKTVFDPTSLPRAGLEFTTPDYMEHLQLLKFVSIWLEALGFDVIGPAGYREALQEFSAFCQEGVSLKSTARESHRAYTRQLYQAMLMDMHQAMRGFWPESSNQYDQLMVTDAMFLSEGKFYTNHRQLQVDLEELQRLERLGCIPHAAADPPSKRTRRSGEGSSTEDVETSHGHPQDRLRSLRTPKPSFSAVGSFAYAVSEDDNSISISGIRYAKKPILDKLGLSEKDICLPAFLSWKGAAACNKAGLTGHEAHDSALHTFSEAASALRSSFDESPYRLPGDAFAGARKGRGRGRGTPATSGPRGSTSGADK